MDIKQFLSDSFPKQDDPEYTQLNHNTQNYENRQFQQEQPSYLVQKYQHLSMEQKQINLPQFQNENFSTLPTKCSSHSYSYVQNEVSGMENQQADNNFSSIFEKQIQQSEYKRKFEEEEEENQVKFLDQIRNEGKFQSIQHQEDEGSLQYWEVQSLQDLQKQDFIVEENQQIDEYYQQEEMNDLIYNEDFQLTNFLQQQESILPERNQVQIGQKYFFERSKNRLLIHALPLWIICLYLQDKLIEQPFNENQIKQIYGDEIGNQFNIRLDKFQKKNKLQDRKPRKKINKKYIDHVCQVVIGISHKTIQDYQTQFRKGIYLGFFDKQFNSRQTMGDLRKFIKQNESISVNKVIDKKNQEVWKKGKRNNQQNLKEYFQNNNIQDNIKELIYRIKNIL